MFSCRFSTYYHTHMALPALVPKCLNHLSFHVPPLPPLLGAGSCLRYVGWRRRKKKEITPQPLSVSNFGLLRSPKAKKAQSNSKGLSTGHPIQVGVSGIPTVGSREVWRRVWKMPRHVIVSVLIKLQNTMGSWFKALIKSALKVNLVARWPFCLYNNLQV